MILSLGGPISPWNYNFRWPLPVMIHRNQNCNIRYRWWNVGQIPHSSSPPLWNWSSLNQFAQHLSYCAKSRNVKLVLKLQTGKIVWIGLLYFSHSKFLSMTKLNLPLTDYSYEWKCCSPRAICRPVQGLMDPGQSLRIPDSGKCFHSKIATLCQIGWIWKESKTFRSFGCSRIQSSCNLCQISTEMYCFGQVASRTKLSSCWHSSCNEPRGKTQTIPSFQGKYPSRLILVNRSPQDVDVLVGLDLWVPRSPFRP